MNTTKIRQTISSHFILKLLLLIVMMTNSGCVSAWLSMTGTKHPFLRSDVDRNFFVKTCGKPVLRRSVNSNDLIAVWLRRQNAENASQRSDKSARRHSARSELLRQYPIHHEYEVFHHHGLMQDPEYASASATVNALTLGASEGISLPFTLLDRATGSFRHHYFLVAYNAQGDMTTWKEIQKDDFLPEPTR
jgi:hypothetical protein